jgi:hypothetical protein
MLKSIRLAIARFSKLGLFLLLIPLSLTAEDQKPLLLRSPSVSRTQVVFAYAGNLC